MEQKREKKGCFTASETISIARKGHLKELYNAELAACFKCIAVPREIGHDASEALIKGYRCGEFFNNMRDTR